MRRIAGRLLWIVYLATGRVAGRLLLLSIVIRNASLDLSGDKPEPIPKVCFSKGRKRCPDQLPRKS